MSVKLQATARGFVKARRVLANLSVLDTRDLLDGIGELVEGQVRRRIEEQEGPPGGGDWEPLSDSYAAWKEGESSGGFLQLYGPLHDSIQHVVSGDEVEIGSNLVYARRQQLGGKSMAPDWIGARGRSGARSGGIHEVDVPARPYLGLSNENQDDVEQAVTDWLRLEIGV